MSPFKDYKLMSATVAASALLILLALVNVALAPTMRWFAVNVLVIMFGASLGWTVGMFASPYTSHEAIKFTSITRAIGAFVTGYVVGKVDSLAPFLLNPKYILSFDTKVRALSFAIALISGFFLTYVYRSYAPNTRAPMNITDSGVGAVGSVPD